MVLAVNSTKAVLGIGIVATAGLIALFFRYRESPALHPVAPSLDPGRYSFLASVPFIGIAYNYFHRKTPTELPACVIGSQHCRFSTFEKLAYELGEARKQGMFNGALVIYGENLNITQDPGILALNPEKVILVGIHIDGSFDDDSLEQLMIKNGWSANEHGVLNIIKVDSVAKALQSELPVNPVTSRSIPTVYRVR
jgi:hypothetical protein